MTTSMPTVTVVELRNNLRKYLERVYFGCQPLVVHRYNEMHVVLVRRDAYEQMKQDNAHLLQEVATLHRRLDAGQ